MKSAKPTKKTTPKTAKKSAQPPAQATTKIIRKALSPKIAAEVAVRAAKLAAPHPPTPPATPALLEQHTVAANRTQIVDLDAITVNGMQLRVTTDADAVERYAEAYRAGENMPPIVVFDDHTTEKEATGDGGEYFLADGHHRVAAARKAGLAELHAIVKKGTRRDATLYAARANQQHGVPFTTADKYRTVGVLLADAEWRQWSDRSIAEAAHVSAHLVAKVRKTLPADQQSTVRKSKDGGVRETKNIGKKPKKTAVDVIKTEGQPIKPGPEIDGGDHQMENSWEKSDEDAFASSGSPSTTPTTKPGALNPANAPSADGEPETLIPEPRPLVERRAMRVHELLADKLDREKLTCNANHKQLLTLALVVGIPVDMNDPPWTDDLLENCWDVLATRVREETIYRLHFQDTTRLPPLKDLAGWWGIKIDDLVVIAERGITE